MLAEKHLRAQSPQCFVFTRAQTKAETQLTAPTKAPTWKLAPGQLAPRALTTCGCYLLAQVPMTLWCPPLDQSLLLNK